MSAFLTSFTPLVSSKAGKIVAKANKINPFIDGSCRREPDFENDYPAITGLCRPGFVKRLKKDDIVVYWTNKYGLNANYLVAILQVVEIVESHTEAEKWYKNMKIDLPNNIMVKGNNPMPLDKTHYITPKINSKTDSTIIAEWDAGYLVRSKKHPHVAICKIWENYLFLDEPTEIKPEDSIKVFNRIPGTQTPPKLTNDEWKEFQELLKIKRSI
ncbi:hypothetical protein MASR1M45_02490 [Candidatus Kapaibacterium sp.]